MGCRLRNHRDPLQRTAHTRRRVATQTCLWSFSPPLPQPKFTLPSTFAHSEKGNVPVEETTNRSPRSVLLCSGAVAGTSGVGLLLLAMVSTWGLLFGGGSDATCGRR